MPQVLLISFYVLGLVMIGVVTKLFASSVTISTTKDQGVVEGIIWWGGIMATLWIVFGGLVVAGYLLGK